MKIQLYITFLLIIITTFSATSAVDIPCECTISNLPFLYFKFVKTCTVKSKFEVTKSDTTIVSLNGKKPTDEPNKDVSFFYVFAKTMHFIPKGLDQLFANLTGLRFELTKLRHVTKENLAPFPELLMFSSVSNQIQFVEKDLFINNPKLKFVSFRSNKITYFDPQVFDVIRPNLAQLYIDGTAITCGFPQATSNAAVGKVLDKLKESPCGDIENAPPLYQFWLKAQEGSENNESDCETEIADKEAECSAQIESLQEENDKILGCLLNPDPATCPTLDQVRNSLRKF
ncbi:hypothetical protein ACKWTF_016314 [Chironomus riparius]